MMLDIFYIVKERIGIYLGMLLFLFLLSCAATSRINKPVPPEPIYPEENSGNLSENSATIKKLSIADQVIETARSFLGSPYKYGGSDENGFDCSGLVFCTFQSVNISLPRSSYNQAKEGKEILKSEIRPGDLIFFAQPGGGISHSGIVENIVEENILFIHSSTSQGVIISSLEQEYWKKRFVKAVRFIDQ